MSWPAWPDCLDNLKNLTSTGLQVVLLSLDQNDDRPIRPSSWADSPRRTKLPEAAGRRRWNLPALEILREPRTVRPCGRAFAAEGIACGKASWPHQEHGFDLGQLSG